MAPRFDASLGVELQLRTGLAELRAQLRRGEDGYVEDLGGAEQFLRRLDDFGEGVDRWAELFLEVADTA